MGWFSRKDDLERRLRALEDQFRGLELEWTNVYDKLVKAMNRTIKNRARLEALERESEEQPDSVQPSATAFGSHPGGLLSPRQKEIQQSILKRRAGG